MLKRFTAVWLAAILLLTAIGSFAETYNMAGYDGDSSSPHTWESNEFFARMQTGTGIEFTFSEYTDLEKWKRAKQDMLNGGELPDVLFKAAITTQESIAFDEKGILIDLLPLLPEYAPNLWALLQEHPDWLAAITLPNGHVVTLPTINELPAQNAMWLNQKWLDTLHLQMPTTMDELHEVLTAFKTKDPNANGKQDEVPLTFTGPWDLKFLAHAYGIVSNDYNLYTDESGELRFWPMEDSFFELIETLRAWYAEGLLDTNGFTTSDIMRRITDDDSAVTYGMFLAPTPMSMVTYTMSEQYTAMLPLVYGGQQVYREYGLPAIGGAFAITRACGNPGEMLRWVDVLYTEEGAIEAMVGYENDTWEWSDEEEEGEEAEAESATRRWNWVGGESTMNTTKLNSLTVYDTGSMPWRYPLAFGSVYDEKNSIRINADLLKLQEYVKPATPRSMPLGDVRTRMMSIQNDLANYVDVIFSQLIIGEVDLTEETKNEIRQQFKQLGCEELKELYASTLQ